MANTFPEKDVQTVTAEGQSVRPQIQGAILRRTAPIEDERGHVTEIYRPSWGVHEMPLVYVYQAMLRPGKVKGWGVHAKQDDRVFCVVGSLRVVLYDVREDSPTKGLLNVHVLSEQNRGLLIIPAGVYHAVQNIGLNDAYFVNMPTRPYDHEDPDKRRLPLKNDLIPFSFDDGPGW